ncbi:hypothetical protein [Micromonospora yangpuensis]|uniref:Uncharacterized protein n=1 Tax=Micromonospora yangpuensis TaxID=683228 RepID=A0A1C6VG45_9ACTN|nr:hypothetical protein [Micromonospora yangpuensis]GGM31158.1 hypothetical protein GCM10012279_57560 [Micromonospora yangpuensis]SCL65157.1 hypothetical protein GA0070617_5679 [Micromonospora yangpuensis]
MTGPFLSLAQIHNRLVLTARQVLRQHQPGPDRRCPSCRTTGCPIADAARDVLHAARELQLWRTAPDSDDPPQPL